MNNVYPDKSGISGLGLFVDENVRKGERICYIKGELLYKKNKGRRDALANPDWVGVGRNLWIDPTPPFKYLNHSCEPNAGILGKVTVCALRPIRKGEEITIDYSITEDDVLWTLEGGIRCLCGTPACRKIIRSIQFLPEQSFKRYLPYIPTYFQKVYLRTKSV